MKIEFSDGTKISLKNEAKELPHMREIELKQEVNQDEIEKASKADVKTEKSEEKCQIVTSPMVGTFYAKPSPTADNFVEVGKKVKKGDVLCIIEAMKLMNEIESEYDGEITEILIKDGDMVDYGKPLFKIAEVIGWSETKPKYICNGD